MKNLTHFVDKCAKIEYLPQIDAYGHYPYKQFVEQIDGTGIIITLDFGGVTSYCYSEFVKYLKKKPRRIYMSMDFPATAEITNDFIAIVSYENNILELYAIPYDNNDGSLLPEIYISETLTTIKNDIQKFIDHVKK